VRRKDCIQLADLDGNGGDFDSILDRLIDSSVATADAKALEALE
jgi:hypothetical protein